MMAVAETVCRGRKRSAIARYSVGCEVQTEMRAWLKSGRSGQTCLRP